jgi:hypothetical protein
MVDKVAQAWKLMSSSLDVGWYGPHRDSNAEGFLEWVWWERLGLRPVRVNEPVHLDSVVLICGNRCLIQVPYYIGYPRRNVQIHTR